MPDQFFCSNHVEDYDEFHTLVKAIGKGLTAPEYSETDFPRRLQGINFLDYHRTTHNIVICYRHTIAAF